MALETDSWENSELTRLWDDIRKLELLEQVCELDLFGLTVVEPDRTGAGGLIDEVRDRCLELMEERNGVRPDLEAGSTHEGVFLPSLHHLLPAGRCFEQLVMNPVALTLTTYLLGETCEFAGTELFVKGPSGEIDKPLQLRLHSDMQHHPAPFPMFAQTVNATWVLTDYTRDNGCLAFHPGSHLYCRQPVGREVYESAVPVEAPAGSLVLWHGNTWHGSFPKRTPGLRMGLAVSFARKYMKHPESNREVVTEEMLARNPARFATLMGLDHPYGWKEEGPDMAKINAAVVRRLHQ